jgi:hypothetical protein
MKEFRVTNCKDMIDIRTIVCVLIVLSVVQSAIADHQDKFYLRGGQVYTGKLENAFILFDTTYGQVKIPNSACRSIDGRNQNLATFHSVNEESIAGLIRNDLDVEQPDRLRITIKKESILKVVCMDRGKIDVQRSNYFQMFNGDRFYGTLVDESFLFTTSYGELDTKFSNVLKIEVVRGQTQMSLANGDMVKGYISSPFIMVRSLYGFNIKIPNTSIKLIQLAPEQT